MTVIVLRVEGFWKYRECACSTERFFRINDKTARHLSSFRCFKLHHRRPHIIRRAAFISDNDEAESWTGAYDAAGNAVTSLELNCPGAWRTSKFTVKFISFSPCRRAPRARDNCAWQRLSTQELTFSAVNSLSKSDSFMNNYRRATPNTTLGRDEKRERERQWDRSIGKEKKKLEPRVPYTSKSTPL